LNELSGSGAALRLAVFAYAIMTTAWYWYWYWHLRGGHQVAAALPVGKTCDMAAVGFLFSARCVRLLRGVAAQRCGA